MSKSRRRLSKPVVRLSVLITVLSILLGGGHYLILWERDEEQWDNFRIAWQRVIWGETEEVRAMLQHKRIDEHDLSDMLLMAARVDLDADQAVTTLLKLNVNAR